MRIVSEILALVLSAVLMATIWGFWITNNDFVVEQFGQIFCATFTLQGILLTNIYVPVLMQTQLHGDRN